MPLNFTWPSDIVTGDPRLGGEQLAASIEHDRRHVHPEMPPVIAGGDARRLTCDVDRLWRYAAEAPELGTRCGCTRRAAGGPRTRRAGPAMPCSRRRGRSRRLKAAAPRTEDSILPGRSSGAAAAARVRVRPGTRPPASAPSTIGPAATYVRAPGNLIGRPRPNGPVADARARPRVSSRRRSPSGSSRAQPACLAHRSCRRQLRPRRPCPS